MRLPAMAIDTRHIALAGFWTLALAVFFNLRWLPGPETILNQDEYIPLAVSEAMRASGLLDPNWALADLPEFFRYDQYNFYLYMIIAHFAILTGDAFGAEPIQSVRVLNVLAQLATLPLLYLTIRNVTGSLIAGCAGVVVFIALPTAVLDASMARPESLLYLASAALAYVSTARAGKLPTLTLWAAVMAFGVGIKITFASLAPLIAGAYLIRFGFNVRAMATDAAIVLGVFIAASFALTPFIFLNPQVTLNGFDFLMNQYAGTHPPHSILHGTLLAYTLHNIHFFLIAAPFILMAGAVGLWYGRGHERVWLLTLLVSFLILLIYFSTRSVFFERNYAHAIIPAIAAGAIGFAVLRRRAGLPLSLLALACTLLIPVNLALSTRDSIQYRDEDFQRFVEANGLAGHSWLMEWESLANQPLPACGQFHFSDFDDGFSAVYRRNALYRGYRIDAEYRSRFVILPASTFQAYLEASHVFISRPCD